MTTRKTAKKAPAKKVVPKQAPVKAGEPAESETAMQHPFAYENGRQAAVSGISRDQAPYADGDELKAWLEGYDSPRV